MNTEEFYARMKEMYQPTNKHFSAIEMPEMTYMAIDGEGDPDCEAFSHAVKWLYSLVFFMRPVVKKKIGKNFVEPPLECMFWADDIEDFVSGNKAKWRWRAMIVIIPELSPNDLFLECIDKTSEKLGAAPESLRIEQIDEGKCVQIMHIGEYSNIQKLCGKLYNEYLPENNLKPTGFYHEIYLNDPNRVSPNNRKVVIRQPVSSC